jgi:hypothetical protein
VIEAEGGSYVLERLITRYVRYLRDRATRWGNGIITPPHTVDVAEKSALLKREAWSQRRDEVVDGAP